jgi:very-short-patch-repair endonuclease
MKEDTRFLRAELIGSPPFREGLGGCFLEIWMTRRRIIKYDSGLKSFSRSLRKNMTEAEKRLWSRLRGKQIFDLQFYRQRPIGNFIVDFYCPDVKLVVEVDGSQHYSDSGLSHDFKRDKFLTSQGLTILRFTNLDVLKNITGVMQTIVENCEKSVD